MKRKIIIDTDPGQDDAMAIMLAVKSGLFDIKAITTVGGNSGIENTTRNAAFILKLLNKSDIPLYSGASQPLKGILKVATVHGKSGLEGVSPTGQPKLTNNAVEKILSIIESYPNEISIVAIGPLTNIANAILKDPQIMAKVCEIIIMGGAIKSPGNSNRVSEFNIFTDPQAAEIVINFSCKKTLIPLDVCVKSPMTLSDFLKIKESRLKKSLIKMVKPYMKRLKEKELGKEAALMYDPLTIFYLVSPQSFQMFRYDIRIETKGELTRGMTVADLRPVITGEKVNCSVAMDINKDEFIKYFIKTLSNDL